MSVRYSQESAVSTSAGPVAMWPDWFEEKVERRGCWLWIGALTSDGYAQAKVAGRFTRVHRWAFTEQYGPLLPQTVLHHRCGDRRCVNPAHLEPMPQAEHWRLHRKAESEATHCPHGHPWDEENTYFYRGKYRQCRACSRERQAVRKQRLRDEAAPIWEDEGWVA